MEVNTNRLEIERALVSTYRSAGASLQRNIGFALERLKPQTPEGRETVRAWLAAEQKEWKGRYSLPKGGVQELTAIIQAPAGKFDTLDSLNRLIAAGAHHDTHVAQAVPALIAYLRNPANPHRQSAINALGNIGLAASNAVPCLMSCLNEDDQHVQGTSIYALGRIGPPAKRAIPAIRAFLKDEPNRFQAANALWRIDSEYVPLALSVFIDMLDRHSLRGDILALALDEMGRRRGKPFRRWPGCWTSRTPRCGWQPPRRFGTLTPTMSAGLCPRWASSAKNSVPNVWGQQSCSAKLDLPPRPLCPISRLV